MLESTFSAILAPIDKIRNRISKLVTSLLLERVDSLNIITQHNTLVNALKRPVGRFFINKG